ncbi:MAG TPA: hypothetical protein PLN93_06690 [Vicinamibacterales bacterium]|nr:hypothetical protein [Vicinamibacterales bacterium]HOQ61005.1 hypothetical protein [Vicinamibacterales bacterium]HPK71610.1 hypothetical protein [Vicinamibacterales bacterium]
MTRWPVLVLVAIGIGADGYLHMLVAARLRHVAATRWGSRRYLAAEWLLTDDARAKIA